MTFNAATAAASTAAREFELTAAEFDRLRELVHRHTGIALSDAKRELVYGRLAKRLRALGLQSFAEYCRLVETEQPEELQELTNAITTNLTAFFREEHHFQQLVGEVLPAAAKSRAASRRMRFWSAGCSTGEEPYSIAISLRETLAHLHNWDIRLLATDIDTSVVARAAQGQYNTDRLKGLSPARCKRWFEAEPSKPDVFTAASELKSLITFKQLNLLHPWRMQGPFDAIFCRNVVIYFDKPTQRILFDRIADLQEPGAWLFIGHSENLHHVTDRYKLVGRTAYRRV
jgi:chemotaxis protein methyltransferase CheR